MISVIVPTYNRAGLLQITLQSILSQTYANYEIIVVDDGSTDNTAEIMVKYPKVRYIRHGKNRGVAEARNTGLKAAQGNYISFIDSDDMMLPDKLEKQIMALEKLPPHIGFVYSPVIIIINHAACITPVIKPGDILKYVLQLQHPYLQSLLIRRCCFDKVGIFDSQLRVAEDWEFMVRLSSVYQAELVNKPLCVIDNDTDGISHNYKSYIPNFEFVMVKHKSLYDLNKPAKSAVYRIIGHLSIMTGNISSGIRYFIKSITNNPTSTRNIITLFGIVVVLISRLTRLNIYSRLSNMYSKLANMFINVFNNEYRN